MRKTILGLVATTAVLAATVIGGSANATTTLSPAPDCVPVTEVTAAPEVNHVEYKYVPAVGTGNVQWSTDSVPTKNFGGVAYVAEYHTNGANKGQHKSTTIIDSAAVQAVDGVTCVIPLPANPLTGINCVLPSDVLATPAGTDKYSFSAVTNHIALNGRIGTTVTAAPGYVFAFGSGTLTSKVFAATPLAVTLAQPTVSDAGVVDFGASTCGTWKIGSKVTLTSGEEFLTHGGTTESGPITRYRLVFTPNAGFTLPSTLPGDGFKVNTSAVFHVYKAASAA